jgi:hypothetical protein
MGTVVGFNTSDRKCKKAAGFPAAFFAFEMSVVQSPGLAMAV